MVAFHSIGEFLLGEIRDSSPLLLILLSLCFYKTLLALTKPSPSTGLAFIISLLPSLLVRYFLPTYFYNLFSLYFLLSFLPPFPSLPLFISSNILFSSTLNSFTHPHLHSFVLPFPPSSFLLSIPHFPHSFSPFMRYPATFSLHSKRRNKGILTWAGWG